MSQSNGKLTYIPDGYTYIIKIEETEWHGPIQIEYRPALSEERAVIFNRMARLVEGGDENKIKQSELTACQAIADHVVWWDINHKGQIIPIDSGHVARLEPHLQATLFRVVMGQEKVKELEESEKNSVKASDPS